MKRLFEDPSDPFKDVPDGLWKNIDKHIDALYEDVVEKYPDFCLYDIQHLINSSVSSAHAVIALRDRLKSRKQQRKEKK